MILSIYLPAKLVASETKELCSIIQVSSRKSGLAYIIAIELNNVEFILAGDSSSLNKVYASIPHCESYITEENKKFYYKKVIGLQIIRDYLEELREKNSLNIPHTN